MSIEECSAKRGLRGEFLDARAGIMLFPSQNIPWLFKMIKSTWLEVNLTKTEHGSLVVGCWLLVIVAVNVFIVACRFGFYLYKAGF